LLRTENFRVFLRFLLASFDGFALSEISGLEIRRSLPCRLQISLLSVSIVFFSPSSFKTIVLLVALISSSSHCRCIELGNVFDVVKDENQQPIRM
jgi:hypothetical protein